MRQQSGAIYAWYHRRGGCPLSCDALPGGPTFECKSSKTKGGRTRPLPVAEEGSVKEEPQHGDRRGYLQPEAGTDVAIGDCDFSPMTPLKRSRAMPRTPGLVENRDSLLPFTISNGKDA